MRTSILYHLGHSIANSAANRFLTWILRVRALSRRSLMKDLFQYMLNGTHELQSMYERIQRPSMEDPGTARH